MVASLMAGIAVAAQAMPAGAMPAGAWPQRKQQGAKSHANAGTPAAQEAMEKAEAKRERKAAKLLRTGL